MKIAIVSPSDKSFISDLLPSENFEKLPIGYPGAVFIGTIIKELLAQGHTVIAITTSAAINNNYNVTSYINNNFTWIVVPSRPKSFRMNGNKLGRIVDFYLREIKEITKVLKTISPDIVHAHWSYEFAAAAVKSGYPFLVTVHDNPFEILRFTKHPYRLAKLLMSEYILRKTKYATTVSPYLFPYLEKRSKEVRVIPNPTPIRIKEEEVRDLIRNRIETKNTPKIIMVNNGWGKLKNGKTGVIAFSKFLKIYPQSELHLYGNGTEIGGIGEIEVKSLGVKNVHFHGAVSNLELMKAFKSCHLLIHPSLEESFGVVLIEAMSMGLPTIGGEESGAVPWVINNKTLLVDVKNGTKLSSKMKEILDHDKEYNTTSIMCYNNVVSRFSSSSIIHEYTNYYSKIIHNSK